VAAVTGDEFVYRQRRLGRRRSVPVTRDNAQQGPAEEGNPARDAPRPRPCPRRPRGGV